MSGLATRCPACSTIFRVVPDQLRVSDGWVRCGRCAEVFNAAERLVDVDSGAPARPEGVAVGTARGAGEQRFDDAPQAAPAAAADFVGRGAAGSGAPRVVPPPPPPPRAATAAAPARRAPENSDIRVDDGADTEAFDAEPPASTPLASAAHPTADRPPDDDVFDTAPASAPAGAEASRSDGAADPTPSFVRLADRAERWRAPRVRAALGAGVVATALLLGAQALHAWRDLLAARHATLRPVLEGACALLGCSVGPPRQIDGLSVESSGLVRVEKSTLYRLSVALRNRAPIAVALPALELSLTDSQGRLLVRRVLFARDLGVNQGTVAPGAELALQATLQAALSGNGSEPVAGYTIELFYP